MSNVGTLCVTVDNLGRAVQIGTGEAVRPWRACGRQPVHPDQPAEATTSSGPVRNPSDPRAVDRELDARWSRLIAARSCYFGQ